MTSTKRDKLKRLLADKIGGKPPRRHIRTVAAGGGSDIQYAEIFDAIQVSANRWKYAANLVSPAGDVIIYLHWNYTLYNRTEDNNTANGVQGNGVNVDNLPAGFSIRPLTVGCVYPVIGGKMSEMNGVDGECE